jgi:RNA polymerase sigma-70 factor (ECF subfamily)
MSALALLWRAWSGRGADTPAGAASDWVLWERARVGHAASAHALVQQLAGSALGLARQMLQDPHEAQDAVQDAFLRLWQAQPASDRGASLSTYFHTIVLNRCKSRLRQRRDWATDPDALASHADAAQAAALPGWQPAPDAPPLSASERQRVQQALARLPARQRLALGLWAYADADVPEIARALDVSPNAAHQLLHRARLNLRNVFLGDPP